MNSNFDKVLNHLSAVISDFNLNRFIIKNIISHKVKLVQLFQILILTILL